MLIWIQSIAIALCIGLIFASSSTVSGPTNPTTVQTTPLTTKPTLDCASMPDSRECVEKAVSKPASVVSIIPETSMTSKVKDSQRKPDESKTGGEDASVEMGGSSGHINGPNEPSRPRTVQPAPVTLKPALDCENMLDSPECNGKTVSKPVSVVTTIPSVSTITELIDGKLKSDESETSDQETSAETNGTLGVDEEECNGDDYDADCYGSTVSGHTNPMNVQTAPVTTKPILDCENRPDSPECVDKTVSKPASVVSISPETSMTSEVKDGQPKSDESETSGEEASVEMGGSSDPTESGSTSQSSVQIAPVTTKPTSNCENMPDSPECVVKTVSKPAEVVAAIPAASTTLQLKDGQPNSNGSDTSGKETSIGLDGSLDVDDDDCNVDDYDPDCDGPTILGSTNPTTVQTAPVAAKPTPDCESMPDSEECINKTVNKPVAVVETIPETSMTSQMEDGQPKPNESETSGEKASVGMSESSGPSESGPTNPTIVRTAPVTTKPTPDCENTPDSLECIDKTVSKPASVVSISPETSMTSEVKDGQPKSDEPKTSGEEASVELGGSSDPSESGPTNPTTVQTAPVSPKPTSDCENMSDSLKCIDKTGSKPAEVVATVPAAPTISEVTDVNPKSDNSETSGKETSIGLDGSSDVDDDDCNVDDYDPDCDDKTNDSEKDVLTSTAKSPSVKKLAAKNSQIRRSVNLGFTLTTLSVLYVIFA